MYGNVPYSAIARLSANNRTAYKAVLRPRVTTEVPRGLWPPPGGQVQCRIDESDQWKESTFRNIVALGDARDDDAAVDEIAP